MATAERAELCVQQGELTSLTALQMTPAQPSPVGIHLSVHSPSAHQPNAERGIACRPCGPKVARRRNNAATDGLSQSVPVTTAPPRPISPDNASIVSPLIPYPAHALGTAHPSSQDRRLLGAAGCGYSRSVGPTSVDDDTSQEYPCRRAATPIRAPPNRPARRAIPTARSQISVRVLNRGST